MTPSRLVRLAFAASLLAAPALHAQAPAIIPAGKPAADSGFHIRVPDMIGAFRMVERKDFEQADLGTMLRYRREDGLLVDVFVYPGPDFARGCDSACARTVIAREGDEFVGAFPQLVQMKYVDTIAVTSDRALVPTPGAPWRLGRHLRFAQHRKGRAEWSDFVLYYLPGYRVKLRATYLPDTVLAGEVARFATEALPALTGARTAGDTTRHIGITTTLAGSPAMVLPHVRAKLAEQGYVVEDSSRAPARLVTAPKYTWPTGSEKEAWHGAESPGVQLVIQLVAKGDSTEVHVSGRSPTRAGWTDAGAAQTLELLSVMQLAATLPPEKDAKGKKPD